jgi:hypothetical protein
MRRLGSIGAGSGDQVDLVDRLERLRAPVKLGVVMLAERDGPEACARRPAQSAGSRVTISVRRLTRSTRAPP